MIGHRVFASWGAVLVLANPLWSAEVRQPATSSHDPHCLCEKHAPSKSVAQESRLQESRRIEEPTIALSLPTESAVRQWPLQVDIPESVLNDLFREDRLDVTPVRDVIAKAEVIGRQRMLSRIQVDCRPHDSHAEIQLILAGAIESNTLGLTRQAAVNTLGRHDVVAIKPVLFDGHQITTQRARLKVDVRNQHVAAATPLDGVPLFGDLARGAALSEAHRRRKQADSETAERLIERIGPQFNAEADRKLAQFNRVWRDELRTRFASWWPSRIATRTTDTQLQVAAEWPDAPLFSSVAHPKSVIPAEPNAVAIHVHESVLNSALQKLDVAGKSFSESELRELLHSFVATFGGRVVNRTAPQAAAPVSPVVRFAKDQPVRVRLVNHEWRLILNASLEAAGQTILAQDEITVPLAVQSRSGEWRLQPSTPQFAKADQGISLVGAWETLVRGQFSNALPEVALPTTVVWNHGADSSTAIRWKPTVSSDSWLMVTCRINEDDQREPKEILVPAKPRLVQPPTAIPKRRPESLKAPRIPDGSIESALRTPSARTTARRTTDPLGWFE